MAATHLSLSLPTSKQVAWAAITTLIGVVYFALIIVVLHALRPDYDPIRLPTSYYAVGPHGFLMSSAFFSMSVASAALVLGLYHGVARPARSRLGLALLGLWAVGVLIAMIFPLNPEGTPLTLSGAIHRVNGPLTFLSLTIGMLLISRLFNRDEKWRSLHRPALILSSIMVAMVIVTLLANVTGLGVAGLAQRISLATLVIWSLLTATRLRSIALGSVQA